MRFLHIMTAFFLAFFGLAATANATTQIHIDLSTQRMHVQSSSGSFTWPVSTARAGYSTPRGSYAPTALQRMHYSKKYHMSPMPHSIFFRGGYAIHGTGAIGSLGRPASHGCVRLHPAHARQLFQMVQSEGGSISITGSPSGGTRYASAHRQHRAQYAALHSRGHHRAHALAYAPIRRQGHGGVKSWQAHPLFSPLFGD
jgi:hypothetical protein